MTSESLEVDPGVVRAHGGILSAAAQEAERSLAASRDAAGAAEAGFPGAAAGPFAALLTSFEKADSSLTQAIERAGSRVGEAADTYEICEARNTEQLSNAWLEF